MEIQRFWFLFCCPGVRKFFKNLKVIKHFILYFYSFSPCSTRLTAERDLSACAWGSIRADFDKFVRDYFTLWQLLLVHRILRSNSGKICCNFVSRARCLSFWVQILCNLGCLESLSVDKIALSISPRHSASLDKTKWNIDWASANSIGIKTLGWIL